MNVCRDCSGSLASCLALERPLCAAERIDRQAVLPALRTVPAVHRSRGGLAFAAMRARGRISPHIERAFPPMRDVTPQRVALPPGGQEGASPVLKSAEKPKAG